MGGKTMVMILAVPVRGLSGRSGSMSSPVPHHDEPARLDAVRRLELLDSAPEPRFDRIVRLASAALDMPTMTAGTAVAATGTFEAATATLADLDLRLAALQAELASLGPDLAGLACDITFSARTAAIQEARQTLWSGARRIMDATRFDQFGRWSGIVRTPDGDIRVDEQTCYGTKDRSWGVRGVGEPEAGGAPVKPNGIAFMWAPLFWDDHVTHAIFFDGPQGEPLVREGIVAPLYEHLSAIPGIEGSRDDRMATARHRIQYLKGSRLASKAEIDLVSHDGQTRTIHLEPVLKFQMKGLGYGHPEWGQGMWKGELALGGESFDPRQLDLLARENLHTQQVVRATDGIRQGVGVFEQIVVGPYAPAGFTQFFDGAR